MQSSLTEKYASLRFTGPARAAKNLAIDFDKAERQLTKWLELEGLDEQIKDHPSIVREFEQTLAYALDAMHDHAAEADSACRFLQRVLYHINRLKLFWFDDLTRYTNERSDYLRAVRNRLEAAWQAWELSHLDLASLRDEDLREGLLRRAADDIAPPPSPDGRYFSERMSEAGYRRLLAIASLDGLVEASQLSRTLGGVGNEINAMMTRLLVEEYGGGRLARKHSSFFTVMLAELGMNSEPEAYFDLVPWEVLAGINHSFLLSERKRFYLRYVGGLLYTEVSVPAAFRHFSAAATRLGMSEAARGYWELHIREDERHGRWMLYDVALPLAEMYPADSWEIMLGYDQQKFISERAGAAVARAVRTAEREANANVLQMGADA